MDYLWIRGGRPLAGEIVCQGAKNSVLPLLAGAIVFRQGCRIHNCPQLTDVEAALAILTRLGCRVRRTGGTVEVDPTGLTGNRIPRALMGAMRSSVLFLGPLLARTGSCCLCQPGGCPLGSRPIDLHLLGLQALGAEVERAEGWLYCRGKLRGAAITLPFPSVGATENLILAALGAEGTTTIYNAAREPEVADLIAMLSAGGANIAGGGSAMLQITGGLPQWAEYRVMPDRMAAATYLCAAAGTGGELRLLEAEPRHLQPVLQALTAAGCTISPGAGELHLKAPARLTAVSPVRTAPYPGFPTDAQAPLMAALARSRGVTVFEENVFASRYGHVPALQAMGANIRTAGAVAALTGVPELHGAQVEATDLRGGAAMVIAALQARGISRIGGLAHLNRGYADFPRQLELLGGDVKLERRGLPDELGRTEPA